MTVNDSMVAVAAANGQQTSVEDRDLDQRQEQDERDDADEEEDLTQDSAKAKQPPSEFAAKLQQLPDPESVHYFEWNSRSSQGGPDLACDVCCHAESFATDDELRMHQLQLHINPHYLSAPDRTLANISDFTVRPAMSDGVDLKHHQTWTPDFKGFKGLYRCHVCFRVWDLESHLKQHLLQHRAKVDLDEDMPLTKVFRHNARSKASNDDDDEDDDDDDDDDRKTESADSSGENDQASQRPSRKCKIATRTLMTLSLSHFPVMSAVRSLVQNSSTSQSVQQPTSAASAQSQRTTHSIAGERENSVLAKKRGPKKVPTRKELSRKRRQRKRAIIKSLPASSNMKLRKRQGQTQGKNLVTRADDDDGQEEVPSWPVQPHKRVEDVLPDLLATRVGRPPSKRSTEAEKLAAVVNHVTAGENIFCCFTCLQYFTNFHQFSDHKNSLVCVKNLVTSAAKTKVDGSILTCNSYDACKSKTDRLLQGCDDEYSGFISKAISRVPEFTFNNMHGTIQHIDTVDAAVLRNNPDLGTVDKVKMNISNAWTTKDVWENGGWEISSSEYLTWQKYENRWSENRRFLQNLAHLPWSEQFRFKTVFDVHFQCKSRVKKHQQAPAWNQPHHYHDWASSSHKFGRKHHQSLPFMLNLRQTSRSVKYMSVAEREECRLRHDTHSPRGPGYSEAPVVHSGSLSGEWERLHRFVCGACNKEFDDLRDVMHHKWDDHPYCLVAHLTLQNHLRLPPSGMMYPQTGRGLVRPTPSEGQPHTQVNSWRCTKCQTGDFFDQHAFYIHLLECGEGSDWDVTSKRNKKKTKKIRNPGSLKPLRRANSTESDESNGLNVAAAAALKRQRRFERFNRPPPQRGIGVGRFTRLQAEMIKKTNGKKKRKVATKTIRNCVKPSKDLPKAPTPAATRRSARNCSSSGDSNQPAKVSNDTTPCENESSSSRLKDLEVIKELVSDMLDKVEKADAVLSKAEQMNMTVESAKVQAMSFSGERKRKRKSDTPKRIIRVEQEDCDGHSLEPTVALGCDLDLANKQAGPPDRKQQQPSDAAAPENESPSSHTASPATVQPSRQRRRIRRSSFADSFYSQKKMSPHPKLEFGGNTLSTTTRRGIGRPKRSSRRSLTSAAEHLQQPIPQIKKSPGRPRKNANLASAADRSRTTKTTVSPSGSHVARSRGAHRVTLQPRLSIHATPSPSTHDLMPLVSNGQTQPSRSSITESCTTQDMEHTEHAARVRRAKKNRSDHSIERPTGRRRHRDAGLEQSHAESSSPPATVDTSREKDIASTSHELVMVKQEQSQPDVEVKPEVLPGALEPDAAAPEAQPMELITLKREAPDLDNLNTSDLEQAENEPHTAIVQVDSGSQDSTTKEATDVAEALTDAAPDPAGLAALCVPSCVSEDVVREETKEPSTMQDSEESESEWDTIDKVGSLSTYIKPKIKVATTLQSHDSGSEGCSLVNGVSLEEPSEDVLSPLCLSDPVAGSKAPSDQDETQLVPCSPPSSHENNSLDDPLGVDSVPLPKPVKKVPITIALKADQLLHLNAIPLMRNSSKRGRQRQKQQQLHLSTHSGDNDGQQVDPNLDLEAMTKSLAVSAREAFKKAQQRIGSPPKKRKANGTEDGCGSVVRRSSGCQMRRPTRTKPKKRRARSTSDLTDKGGSTSTVEPVSEESPFSLKSDHQVNASLDADCKSDESSLCCSLLAPDPTQSELKSQPSKKRRSSFAASFYSQAPRRKVLRRTAARISMERVSECEALMMAIFDDSDDASDAEELPTQPQATPKLDLFDQLLLQTKCGAASTPKVHSSVPQDMASSRQANPSESVANQHRPLRRRKSTAALPHRFDADLSHRVTFPIEVRAEAIERIRQGETQSQVAKDLDCAVSTVAGWWHRRHLIAKALDKQRHLEGRHRSRIESNVDQVKKSRLKTKSNKSMIQVHVMKKAQKKRHVKMIAVADDSSVLSSTSTTSMTLSPEPDLCFTSMPPAPSTPQSSSSASVMSCPKLGPTDRVCDTHPLTKASSGEKGADATDEDEDDQAMNGSASQRAISRSVDSIIRSDSLFQEQDDLVYHSRETAGYAGTTDDDDDDDDDDEEQDDGDQHLRITPQGIKNQILKNCFASLASRHT